MLAGHLGVAGIVKSWRPTLPMGVLLVASQLPDIVFLPLAAIGVERLEPVAGASGYGSLWIDALYSHALLSNILLAVVTGVLAHLLAQERWGLTRAGSWPGRCSVTGCWICWCTAPTSRCYRAVSAVYR